MGTLNSWGNLAPAKIFTPKTYKDINVYESIRQHMLITRGIIEAALKKYDVYTKWHFIQGKIPSM